MAKNHSAKHTHHVKLAGKRITHLKDVGKALEIIYVPRGPDKIKTPAMTQMVKENPKSSITQNIRLSPTHFKKKPESENYFRHDSKYMPISRFDNTSYQILRQLNLAISSKTPMAPVRFLAATDGTSIHQDL